MLFAAFVESAMRRVFMRRTSVFALLCSWVVLLAGCGQSDNTVKVANKSDGTKTVTVIDNKGTQVTVGGAGASATMPTYAPLFPGSTVETSVTLPNQSGSVAFKTSASIETVMAFYKKSLGAAGFKDTLNMVTGDTTMYTASDEKGAHSVNVVATKSSDGTQVQLGWN
jgi:hypothetical protein